LVLTSHHHYHLLVRPEMRFQAVCELAQAWCWWKVLESASTMNVGVAVVDSEAQVRTIEDPFPNVAKHPLGLEIHCRLAGAEVVVAVEGAVV
jgi:hypothetical protein